MGTKWPRPAEGWARPDELADAIVRVNEMTRDRGEIMKTTITKVSNDSIEGIIQIEDAFKDVIPQHQPGAKLDSGKADLSLLLMFGRALTEVARVGTAGAKKYTRGGWQSVPDGINRYTAALGRHLMKEHYEVYDSDVELCKYDAGIMHAAQVAWNALARLELMLREQAEEEEYDLEQK